MAEKDKVLTFSEKEDSTSQSKDVYIPEEPTSDVSISLLDIQIPSTPDSTKEQISDGDTSRLESPKMVKPVLGKVQAKKRLMAFANKLLPKSQIKSNLSQHSTGALKTKDKAIQDDISINKSRKKTEEKILAIEEIRREESKSKMLLAEAMAAACMEDENHVSRNTLNLLENRRRTKEKNKHDGMSDSRKNTNKSTIERKYSERHRYHSRSERDSFNQEIKERNESAECFSRKLSQNKEKHEKKKKNKDDRDKRDNNRTDINHDKKEIEKEKREETKEKREAVKNKKEDIKEKRYDLSEMEIEIKDKKEKDKDREKEKELIQYNSWAELRKVGLSIDDLIQFRKRDNTERTIKNRTEQDFARYLEQMLILNNFRLKRYALIAEGLDGPKKYPPESIKMTKRGKGSQVLYSENPSLSLFLNTPQLLQSVTSERREKIREICEASSSRMETEDMEEIPEKRDWYQQIDTTNYHKGTKWKPDIESQFPRSKWDSEDEETSSASIEKEEIRKQTNKLHASLEQQEECSSSSSTIDEDKIDNTEDIKENIESNEKIINNTNDETSISPLLQTTGDAKLASEYEQFMKMVCTDNPVTDVTKEYSPNKISIKPASPCSYHEFNIESNLVEDKDFNYMVHEDISRKIDNTDIEILKGKLEERDKLEGSIKSIECEESTLSIDCQIQLNEGIGAKHISNNESEDSKSIPSDWENVRIKVERLSDENTESKEVKRNKRQKKIMSSTDSSSSTTSSDSEKEKKKKKRKRKRLSNSSSSDSDSTDSSSSSSSSDSTSSDEKRKRKRKKKKIGKKRRKAKRIARKKKRRRKMSTDSSSSDSDEQIKKKKRNKKKMKKSKLFDMKSSKNIDRDKVISPVIPLDETKLLQSMTPTKKIKEEVTIEDKKRIEAMSTRKTITNINIHDKESMKHRRERKENKSDENFLEEWERDAIIAAQQNEDDTPSQEHVRELEKIDKGSEKDKHRRKRKQSRDKNEQIKENLFTANEEMISGEKGRLDDEIEIKKRKRREKDTRSSTEFLADWERESERITQQIIQNEVKISKTMGKSKKEKWGETDFDTLNVPSLTQLEKEVSQRQLLADEWEVDSLEAVPDLIIKRKCSQNTTKKMEKEVKYDKKTDTYIAIEKESVREMRKRQERLCATRIWEDEQEEGEKEEMMLLEKRKKHKRDDWDIEEESYLLKNNEDKEICKVADISKIENVWALKNDPDENAKNSDNLIMKLEPIASKRAKKSRWDMGSQSEEKLETKDIWEEEYEWSKISKYEQKLNKRYITEGLLNKDETEREDSDIANCPDYLTKSDLINFYNKKSQNRESMERSWISEETTRTIQNKHEDSKVLISLKTDEEQITSIKKGHQTKNQLRKMLDLDAKYQENTVELYSPSSPAFSQKSQDIEASNDSNSSNSFLREKRRKEMLLAEESSIPTAGIPLQLTKLRSTKHITNDKIEDILNMQLDDKLSTEKFDIKASNNLFDDLSMNEPYPEENNSKSTCMDIFAEYGSEQSRNKQFVTGSNISSTSHAKEDEINEGKAALKLIPKQLLIRRTNEQVKSKRILETPLQDPAQHAAALLTIQKKLLESHALKNDNKELSNEESIDSFKYNCTVTADSKAIDKLDRTKFVASSESSVTTGRQSPTSEKLISIRSEQSKSYDKEDKNDDIRIHKPSTNRNLNDNIELNVRERKRRSPNRKDSEKRYLHDKNRKERKSDDVDKHDRKENRNLKFDFTDSRRKTSPSGRERKRRSRSPYSSWDGQRSGSRSWSRSRSKSPRRKDEAITSTSMRDRKKKRERYDDERSTRPRTDERREKYTRSPPRSSYNEDTFKKHGSSKGNRDDWGRRRHESIERDRDKGKLYDPIEMLRERAIESEKYRDNRFHAEGGVDHTFWQYESGNVLRDANESMDSYATGQELPLDYDDRSYYREESFETDMMQDSPQSVRYRKRFNAKRGQQWENEKESFDMEHHGHLVHGMDKTLPSRSHEHFRLQSQSHSRSWSRSRSRTQSRSRSRSRSTSKSRSRVRSRSRSDSRTRMRSPQHALRISELQSSRSPSPGRSRLNEIERGRKNDENKKLDSCTERGRRIETIVQSGTSVMSLLDSEIGINSNMDTAAANFQYPNDIESGNAYYYSENNLTYPPCIDESSTSSPKRLSLDDRLELELGIKKQHSKDPTSSMSSEYPSNFNTNVIAYPSPPQQQQQMMYRQQPTVLQVGNVLQVVPADFNGVQAIHRETVTTPPTVHGSSQVVRVGNVLQVVPTSLDWGGGQSSTMDQSNTVLHSTATPTPSPIPSVPMSVPVPLPVPVPVPLAVPSTMSPASLPLSLPVPAPVPVPVPATTFPKNEVPQKIAQPVYNYEAILELRRKEHEERKRLRKKEKERRKIERTNRRALRLLEKNSMIARQTGGAPLDQHKSSIVDPSVLKALREGEEQGETESSPTNAGKEEEATPIPASTEEDEDEPPVVEEDEDEDDDEPEVEDDEEEEEEAEDEDEDDDDDDEKTLSQATNQQIEIDEATITPIDANKTQAELENKEWPELPPPPLKGILVVSGFRNAVCNGDLDLSDVDDNSEDASDKDEEVDQSNECDKDMESDAKLGISKGLTKSKSKLIKSLKKKKRSKKSVQFADGIKPGEGTSPSGGEGDMPSPPPPAGLRDGLKDLRKKDIRLSSFRKSRKQEKRPRPPKAKKKVKVKIIKLKKPRVTPLTAMMMDDSDELDDRSPPPPPPGSPPPPHLWPSYLSIYNTAVRTSIEPPQTTTSTLAPVQAPPPPTPLPLLVPPPPLNYTIQPCSKA